MLYQYITFSPLPHRVKILREQSEKQKDDICSINDEQESLRDRMETLAEKHEDIKDRQEWILKRYPVFIPIDALCLINASHQ